MRTGYSHWVEVVEGPTEGIASTQAQVDGLGAQVADEWVDLSGLLHQRIPQRSTQGGHRRRSLSTIEILLTRKDICTGRGRQRLRTGQEAIEHTFNSLFACGQLRGRLRVLQGEGGGRVLRWTRSSTRTRRARMPRSEARWPIRRAQMECVKHRPLVVCVRRGPWRMSLPILTIGSAAVDLSQNGPVQSDQLPEGSSERRWARCPFRLT